MARIGVLVVAVLALGACRDGSGGAAKQQAVDGQAGNTVAVTGVVSGVDDTQVEVTTDDGRHLAFRMNDAVSVTLAGGRAESAVITEGAPVRVSYRPKGSGGDLVTIDVEPQATTARGEARQGEQGDPPADPARAQR